jgi:hypothetical protein
MFRGSGFKLTMRDSQDLEHSCVFGVGLYIYPWFLSRLPTAAPSIDLKLLKLLTTFDSPASKSVLKKLCGQLWHLSEDLMASTFFDRGFDVLKKVQWWKSQKEKENSPKRISLDQSKIPQLRLCDFVTVNTRNFFQILDLRDSFLEVNPEVWLTNPDYLQAEDVVREIRVVNDTAERWVTMI